MIFLLTSDLDQVDYNSIGLNISINNFVTKFNLIEENNVMGESNSIENVTSYNFR
jgi:hypothetical protein